MASWKIKLQLLAYVSGSAKKHEKLTTFFAKNP